MKTNLPAIGLALLMMTTTLQGYAAPFYTDKLTVMQYQDDSGALRPIRTKQDWEIRRKHILENMQEVMGPLPSADRIVALDPQLEEETDCGSYIRKKLTIAVEASDRLPTYLLLPKSLPGKAPGVLCLHQTTEIGKKEPVGLGGKVNLRYAQELAERGYVCVAPDYPNFGDYKVDAYAMGYVSATMKGIWNHMRCVDFLQSLPEVDGDRIGAIGHSLGGHNTLYAGTFDTRIKAMVTSCGFNSFPKYYGGNLTGWSHKGYMPRIAEVYGTDPARMPFNFTEVLAALAPRAVFINAPINDANFEVSGVYDCVRAAQPVYALEGVAGNLEAVHPLCEHDFPPDTRQQAYAFLGKHLRHDSPRFAVAPFAADITAPIGHPCMGGGIAPAREIVDSLMACGLVLVGPDAPIVFCSLDWCELRNDAYDYWRAVLADAAGTSMDRVLLSCIHQHDAPIADLEAQRMLTEHGLKNSLCVPEFVTSSARKTADALRTALESPILVTHYGVGEAAVREVASNRRVVSDDGSVAFSRTSATADPNLRAKPEGVIDPWLKCLSFWNGDTPVASITNYALHPMSYYGKGGVSKDFVGHARERRRLDDPKVHQIYFSGCSGDIVAGKWNDGAVENRAVLAGKMYQGMVEAFERTQRHPLERVAFRSADLILEPNNFGNYSDEATKRILGDRNKTIFERNLAAMGQSWRQRLAKGQPIDVPCVDFGRAQFLLMPGESFVEYQLIAQGLRPDSTVLVAGYGESAPGYIPTMKEHEEGFSGNHDWLWVGPTAEASMRAAMQQALAR